MRRVTVEERRARLGRRQRLAHDARAQHVSEAAASVVGLHSTDPVTVYLSARARVANADPATIERALYEERSVVRMLGMRRTLFVVPRALRPVVQAACTDTIAVRERARLEGWLAASEIAGDPGQWLARAERLALDALAARGEASTAELTRDVPELAQRLTIGQGKWTAVQSAASRVLPLLAAQGLLLRGRPLGTWVAGQYRWTPAAAWLGEDQPPVERERAVTELVGRWLHGFGPATLADVRWWTGLGAGHVRKALAAVGAVEVDLGGETGFLAADDVEPVQSPEPWAALLPSLDLTVMGWTQREWYLGDRQAVLFDRNGNAGPTVWWDGRVVGAWVQRADGEIVTHLLEDVGADGRRQIDAEAEALAAWLGDVRVKPRFPTPVVQELAEP
jgi:winged helix DNA-binding protein